MVGLNSPTRTVLKVSRRCREPCRDTSKSLDRLEYRLSRKAWVFFRSGYGRRGLHDGQLLSFAVGYGLNYSPDGSIPFRLNGQAPSARVEFLNYEQPSGLLDVGQVPRSFDDAHSQVRMPSATLQLLQPV